jgi:hypothetical protein
MFNWWAKLCLAMEALHRWPPIGCHWKIAGGHLGMSGGAFAPGRASGIPQMAYATNTTAIPSQDD